MARPAKLPEAVSAHRTIGPFGHETLPSGLRRTDDLAEGVWGLVELAEGRILFVWEDRSGDAADLQGPAQVVVPPQVPHHVKAEGNFRLSITFYRA